MTIIATSDGWCGGFAIATSDGWPPLQAPITSDGFVTQTGPIGPVGGQTALGGGGGFRKKRKHRPPLIPLDKIFADLGAPEVYEALAATDKGEEAAGIVRKHARSEAAVPQAPSIDWNALRADAEATGKLLALYQRHMIELDDEEFMRFMED